MFIVLGNFGDGWEVVSEGFNSRDLAAAWILVKGENADEYEDDNFPKYAIVDLHGVIYKITGTPRMERTE